MFVELMKEIINAYTSERTNTLLVSTSLSCHELEEQRHSDFLCTWASQNATIPCCGNAETPHLGLHSYYS